MLEACFEGVGMEDVAGPASTCAAECLMDATCRAIDLSGGACQILTKAEERQGVHARRACLAALPGHTIAVKDTEVLVLKKGSET